MTELRELVLRLTKHTKIEVNSLDKEELAKLLDRFSDSRLEKVLKEIREGKKDNSTVDKYLSNMTRDGIRALAKALKIKHIARTKDQLIADIKKTKHTVAQLKKQAKN